jgi:hypothetical protein
MDITIIRTQYQSIEDVVSIRRYYTIIDTGFEIPYICCSRYHVLLRYKRLTLLLYLEFHEDPSITFVTLYYHVMFAETTISWR